MLNGFLFTSRVTISSCIIICEWNRLKWRINALCAMIVAVAGCSVLVFVFTWWQLGCSRSAKPKKGIHSVACLILAPRPDLSILPHPGWKHFFFFSSTEVKPTSPWLSTAHEDYGTRNQLTQKDTFFSSVVILDTNEDTFAQKAEELLAMVSSKQTDVHSCLGNFSVFNRILAVWFDVLLSNTKKYRVCFMGFPLFLKLY